MEFPNLGKYCGMTTCNQLDFLPMNCDACTGTFCRDHITYQSHQCNSAYKKDIQVPVCPLCNKPIPVARGELPDFKVGQHIDSDCQSDPAKAKRKVYTNRCAMKTCKQKEMTFCVLSDVVVIDYTFAAAVQRQKAPPRTSEKDVRSKTIPAGMSEDEALAMALHNSLNQPSSSTSEIQPQDDMSQEEADSILAQTLQQSESDFQEEQQRRRQHKSCVLA